MHKYLAMLVVVGGAMLAACATANETPLESMSAQARGGEAGARAQMFSSNSVTTPDGKWVGASELQRGTDRISLRFAACCLSPQNAYTAWWLIGDVDKSILAVRAHYATGFVADTQEIRLDLELEAGELSYENPLEGFRLIVLDHGPSTGNPLQLKTPGGGCPSTPCPIVFTTAHPAP